ncbi:MAG: DUF1634 domain-containing protein [Myxococcales bacterium]
MSIPTAKPSAQATGALETVIAVLLRSGVFFATTFIVLGMALSFARHPDYRTSERALATLLDPATSRAPGALLATLPQLRGQPFVLLGLILLVATPILRVAVTSATLAKLGERRLALIGLGVLLLLLASFALGTSPA